MTKPLKIYQVDAFTKAVFGGNPAAVFILENWLPDATMQNIAAENNLAETAFAVKTSEGFDIRWFTPTTEVELCGHATLATAHILFNHHDHSKDIIRFQSRNRGPLMVKKDGALLSLNFPADFSEKIAAPAFLAEALGQSPIEVYKGKTDVLALFDSQDDIESIVPDFGLLKKVDARGVIITAPGKEVDFVSRFFAPAVGVDEDPVTGSAHTTLIPFWSKRLGKNELEAQQLSDRKGELTCLHRDDRVIMSGHAVTYMMGEISL